MRPRRTTRVHTARLLRKQPTWAEKRLWRILRGRRFSGFKWQRQYRFGPHILDFYCAEARLNVELDGFTHGHPARQQADGARDAFLRLHGVRTLRFWNHQVAREIEVVRNAIWEALHPDVVREKMVFADKGGGAGV